MLRKLNDDRGATAIEYGLIAGLVAIGIVGSLVNTRGSLSSVFGQLASQIASATTASPAAPPATTTPAIKLATSTIPQSATWTNRTLVDGSPTDITNGKRYTFTDGSYVKSAYDPSTKRNTINISDPNILTKSQNVVSDDGSYVYSLVVTYYDTAMVQIKDMYSTRVSTTQSNGPPVVNQIDFTHYNTDGSTSSSTLSPTTAQSSAMDSLYYYNKYFSSIK
jgi:pilus assembly protein Flp/PilA